MPMTGVLLGLAVTGVLIYLQIASTINYNFCSVLDDDFSSGTLNPTIWTIEQEVGGFGYVSSPAENCSRFQLSRADIRFKEQTI